jgi:peroxiredoxin
MQASATPAPRKRLWLIVGATLLAAIGAVGFLSISKAEPAPQLTYKTITGETVTPESLKGKVVMVNFWATSCTTCVAEMPQMVQTYNKYKGQGLEFVAVAMSYDAPNYVVNFAETRALPFKVVMDLKGDIAGAFGKVQLTPTTFVIGKDGKVIKRYVGAPEFPELHALLEKAIKA